MVRALSVTLVIWALCAYSMYSYREMQLEKMATESGQAASDSSSFLKKINEHAETNYGHNPTWVGRGRFEIDGEPAFFEVMFMTMPSIDEDRATSFLGRMFLHWRGKTFNILDDSQYAGTLIMDDGHYYIHWTMPAELRQGFTAIMATMPEGDGSHFRMQQADSTWEQSAYIQWQKMNGVEWFDTFDRQIAQIDARGN